MDTTTKRCWTLKGIGKGIIVLAVMLAWFGASAQDVTVTVNKNRQNLPASLTELIDNPGQYVGVTLQNNLDVTTRVYLKMSLTSDYVTNGAPLSLTTQEKGNVRPFISLRPHETRRFTSISDFTEHFSGRLTTTATTDMLTMTRIPEGNYSLCFEVYRWQQQVLDDGEPMSNDCAEYIVCYTGSAPELVTPIMAANSNVSTNGTGTETRSVKEVKMLRTGKDGFVNTNTRDPNTVTPSRLITIRWTEVITNCPHTSRINYTVKIVRVAQGLSPEYAIDHSAVIFSKDCQGNNYCQIDTLRNLEVPFERGATYAVQVEAKEVGQQSLVIGNDGKSQVITFTWGKAAYAVNGNRTPNGEPENRAQEESSNESSKNDVLASMRQAYVVYPYRDETSYNAVHAKFSDEATQVLANDKSVQVKFMGSYNDHVVNTKMSPYDIKWMPVRGNNLRRVRYNVDLFEDMGALSDINTRVPLASKTIDDLAEGEDTYLTSTDPKSLNDTTWLQYMEQGKKYIVRVTAEATYNYYDYQINKTVHYVNDIPADTEYDTVKTKQSDNVTYTSTMNFQWGVDSSLLDRVLPPQFTAPINRSTANWDDTSFMKLSPTIDEFKFQQYTVFSWKGASNLDIEDEDSALYSIYFYEMPKGKDIDSVVNGKAKFHKDSIDGLMLEKDIIDSLKKNQIYVARVRVLIPDTSKYMMCNHGWSHPIAFKFVEADTNKYEGLFDVTNACFPGDTAQLSKELITPKVDSLVNNRVKLKMGRFNLVVQSGKKDDKNRYSGEGYVEWTPVAGYGCGIKVKFDTIQINKDKKIISGTAHSVTADSNNYLNLNMGNNKYGAGFDMYADEGMEMLGRYSGYLGSTGEDVVKWYNIINQYANPVEQLTHAIIEGGGSVGVVTTPIKVNDKMLGGDSIENVSVAVNDFFFSPVTAQFNLLAVYSSHEDNLYLPFLATNICAEPNSFISDSIGTIYMFMAQDMEVPLSDGYTMTFKRPTKLTDHSNGTHIALDTSGFKEIAVDVEISFGTKDQPGNKVMAVDIKQNGIVKPDKPVKAYFYTKFKSWSDWVVKIGMDPFTVVGCEDFAFVPTGSGMWYDHSVKETPKEIKLPKNYMTVPKKNEQWRGFYLDKFAVMLPADVSNTFIDLAGDSAVKQDTKFVTYNYGVNGQIKDSTEVIPEGSRINFAASQLIIDSCGLSVDVSANNLLRLETKNGGGWAFSLDTVGIRFLKSSFKEGYIIGKLKIPLFTGNMKYSCSLGTDSIDFAITPGDSLQLDLYLAKVDLDKKSTHFRITHDFGGHTYKNDWDGVTTYTMLNQDATTRVDLTLNGEITIDFKKFKVPVSLPKIKFENMYMRNFTSTTVDLGKKKGKVEAYKFGDWDFSIGNWSKASPQKYVGINYTDSEVMPDAVPLPGANPIAEGDIGGFHYCLDTVNPTFEKVSSGKYTVGIFFGGSMSLGIGKDQSVSAGLGFGISCDVATSNFKVDNWNGVFDSAHVTTDIGSLKVEGFIGHSRNDAVFGNCWKGMLHVEVMNVVKLDMGAGFGTCKRKDDKGDSVNYDWWYFEGAAVLPNLGIPIGGVVSINGFGGAFAYNMQPKTLLTNMSSKDLMGGKSLCDNMVSNTGSNYTPKYDAWIARAGVSLILTGQQNTMNANGIFNLRIANGHFAGISLQVDAKLLSSYNETTKEGANAALTVGAFIDYTQGEDIGGGWKLNFAARVNAEIDLSTLIKGEDAGKNIAKAYTYPTSSTEAAADGKSGGMSSSWLDKKVQDSKDYDHLDEKLDTLNKGANFTGGAKFQLPVDFYVRQYGDGKVGEVSGKNVEWFFSVGRPNKADRVIFSANLNLVDILKFNTEWTFYIMTGNYFPGGFQLPEIPDDVKTALGSKYASYSSKHELVIPGAGGFAIGGSFHADLSFEMFIYLKAAATIGFDLGLLATNGAGCPGYSTIGKNGFYAMGQIYCMFSGEVGLCLNLGFWKGHLSLASASVAALLQGGGPKPTWAYGLLAFKASCLGGLVKINTSVDFSMGHVCIPGNSDPLANVKLFQNVTPSFNTKSESQKAENIQSPYTTGTIVSNLPWNEDVYLCADQKYGNGTTTRKFKFILCKNECSATYQKRSGKAYRKNGRIYYNSATTEPLDLTFTPNNMETNMQYFAWNKGGLPQYSDIKIKLKGRAFEWRPTYTNVNSKKDEINLSKAQRDTDYYYNLDYRNYYNKTSYKDPSQPHWRDPVFTDRDVTTHHPWTQDTIFYIRTNKLPDNLENAVVFTWPYNGDPMFPIDEFVKINNRRRALIYLYQADLDFLSNKDEDDREVKAFLLLRGIGANNDALACDYVYHPNGYLGSTTPCIEVILPSTFTNKYENYDMAIRLLLVNKEQYSATLDKLRAQANETASSMQQKMEVSRRNASNKTKLAAIKQQYTTTKYTYDKLGRRRTQTTVNTEALNNNVQYQQLLKSTEEQDFYGKKVSDTNMAFARKMLKNDYAICLQAGKPIYTLYFRLYSGASTYSEILGNSNNYINGLFGGPSLENQTTSISNTHQILSNDYYGARAAKYAYLFATYKPTDQKAYHVGITLPPIIYAVLDWSRTKFNYHEYALYNIFATRLIDMDNAVKATWAPSQRPGHYDNKFKLSEYPGGWTDEHMGTADERSAMYSQVFSKGFKPVNGLTAENNFTNLSSRMYLAKTGGIYSTVDATYRRSFPQLSGGKLISPPNIIKLEISSGQQKWRYDSTSIGEPASKTIGGNRFERPEYSYCSSFTNVDEATPAILTDIKRYHDFYQDLFDYALYVHSRGWSYKRDQYRHLIKYTYRENQFTTNNFPYTITRSTLMTWWMWHWRGIYWAGGQKRQNTKYDKMKNLAIPYDRLISDEGVISTYWMTYILHWDQVPYKVADDKGTIYEDLFTNEYTNNNKFSRWRTKDWFNYETTGGGKSQKTSYWLVNASSVSSYGTFNTVNYRTRYVPLNYYYIHGGTLSDYSIFGKIADAVREHDADGNYTVMANTYKQSDDTYYYSLSDKAVQRVNENAGITFRAINTKNEESSARNRQSGQWE